MPITAAFTTLRTTEGKSNSVIYIPSRELAALKLLIVFPGDVSDFAFSGRNDARLVGHEDCHDYAYSLESMAWEIASRVSSSTAIAIFKSNMKMGHHSIYSNFLICDSVGNPRWADMDLLQSLPTCSEVFLSFLSSLQIIDKAVNLETISIAGFSKGCILLSAFLRDRNPRLLSCIDSLTFIDPGLHVHQATFPFSDLDYSLFADHIRLNVFVSPYQDDDPERAWLRFEIRDFVAKSHANFHLVCSDCPRTLSTHFATISYALQDG